MARYIDADELVKSFELSIKSWGRDCNSNAPIMMRAYQDALYRVKTAPTADVVEVKHGRWIEDGYYEEPCVCSICGEEAKYISTFEERFDYDWEENLRPTGYEEIREYIRTPYCPNCGAKMDGKE